MAAAKGPPFTRISPWNFGRAIPMIGMMLHRLIHWQPSILEQRPHIVIQWLVLGRLCRGCGAGGGPTDNCQYGGGCCNQRHLLRTIIHNDLICKTLQSS